MNTSTTGTHEIRYIVLEKTENAKVAVSTIGSLDVQKGQFKVSFTASEVGEYKVQTVVRYDQTNGVVKYYSGTETITVGNTGIEDVVVMSVGSNEIVKNGKVAVIDAAPIVENNRTFVPFRALAEAFGITVTPTYDDNGATADILFAK